MFVQSDPSSTKPGVPCSNHGGRATAGNGEERAASWPPTAAQIARFALNIDASAGPSACHPWQGAPDRDGYGRFYSTARTKIGAHRFALQLKLGRELEPDEVARHSNECNTRLCCNQDHLSEGTQADNIRDRDEAGRAPAGERNAWAKLTDAKVVEIRRRHAGGEKQIAIARSLGVGRKCVEHVVHGRNWKHVPAPIDYRAERLAMGMTPEQADAIEARARRLAKRVVRGELSLQQAAEISDVATLVTLPDTTVAGASRAA